MVTIDFGQPTTADAINADYEARYKPRLRLGLSQIGNPCKRYLWYAHHGSPAKLPEGRVLRLFQLGNILEEQTILDLKSAGVLHHSWQKEVFFTRDDITLTGHIDGIVEGLLESPATPHLFEHKTCSLKKYNELLKCCSYQAWNETYYWQCQAYMLGLKLTRAAVFVYCKDNSELYFERIKLDRQATIDKLQSVFDAISEAVPPKRMCPKQSWYAAQWCHYAEICWR